MVIPAMPTKCFSPLKVRHNNLQFLPELLPDLGESLASPLSNQKTPFLLLFIFNYLPDFNKFIQAISTGLPK